MSSTGPGASQEYEYSEGILRSSGIENTSEWANGVEHAAETSFGSMYTKTRSTETTKSASVGLSFKGAFGFKGSYKTTNSHSTSNSVLKTENNGIANHISATNARAIRERLDTNRIEKKKQVFGNNVVSGAGTVWQFKYQIGHLFGTNVIGTQHVGLTDGIHEPPCCLPGTFLGNGIAHGPCETGYPCVCSDFTCLSCPAGKFKSSAGNGSCILCDQGKYWATRGTQTACSRCDAGQYAADTGLTQCSECQRGTYIAFSGASECIKCASGKYSFILGASSTEVCISCP